MLNRTKIVYIHCFGTNDNSARMLSGGVLYVNQPLGHTLKLCLRGDNAFCFVILSSIKAYSGFVCNCADCARLKYKCVTKQLAYIFVSCCLIFARKVKVNIGNFVAFKAQKCFKRNVKTILFKLCAADGTILIGHINPDVVFPFFKEFIMLAVWAYIVGAQGVNLGYPCKICRK